jgi:exodeoxyribonuclease V alpha subunit
VTKKPDKTTITGEISAIRFRNSEGWSVFSIKSATTTVNCTGTLADMCDSGVEVTCTGIWEESKFGRQLKCEQIVPTPPDVKTDEGIVRLLQRLPGIGPKKAMQAVMQHGHEEAWKLACTDPEAIGVKPEHAEEAKAISATLLESYAATVYLLGLGLTDHQAGVIYRQYGSQTVKVVSEDPYRMTEIDGMGFISVDKIALKAGVSVGNPARIAACVLYVLHDSATNGGHIFHDGWSLADIVQDTLTNTAMKAEVPMGEAPGKEDIRQQVHFLAKEGKVEISKGRVFSRELLEAERNILGFMGRGGDERTTCII